MCSPAHFRQPSELQVQSFAVRRYRFLLFGSNGLIVAHWAPQFDLTRWVGLILYVLGVALGVGTA
jgi:hypothetical protein